MKFLMALLVTLVVFSANVSAQTTAFTYQGKLTDGGSPPTGQYDFKFKLFDLVSGGTQIGADVLSDDLQVTGGVFTVNLDFGASPFTSGAPRYLEIAVRAGASTGAHTTLAPRQLVTANPYAIKSLNSATADGLSVACVNCVTSGQISSVAGSQVSGAIPVASVPAGSGNYIQNNPASTQTTSNFNIAGNGTVGGTLTGNAVNATTQFNIGGNRILSGPGTGNIFAGQTAGLSNTSGMLNSFFGNQAGEANIGGGSNSFFGERSGLNSQGINNSFFGAVAGQSNVSGGNNTILGTLADVGSPNLSFATAIGAGAVVSSSGTVVLGRTADRVEIPGALNVTGLVGIGTPVPGEKLTVAGRIQSTSGGFKFPDGTVQTTAANTTFTLHRNLAPPANYMRWGLWNNRTRVASAAPRKLPGLRYRRVYQHRT